MNWAFFKGQPYGVLMASQTIISFVAYIVPYVAEFWFEGITTMHQFVLGLFITSLIINILHLFGWNRKVLSLSSGINLFLPCTLVLFAVSLIYTLILGYGSLIALIGFVDSYRFTRRLILAYGLLSASYIVETFICGYLVVLLGRVAPNGQIFGLATVIIDGDKTSRFEHSAPRFSPVATPTAGPQHI